MDTEEGFCPKAQGLTFLTFYQLPWSLQEFKITFLHLPMTTYVNQENLSGTIEYSMIPKKARMGQPTSEEHRLRKRGEEHVGRKIPLYHGPVPGRNGTRTRDQNQK